MKREEYTEFKEMLILLKKTVKKMEKLEVSHGNIRGKYAEIHVAYKLRKYISQIDQERDIKSADIYLLKLGKRVEVKSSIFKGDYWAWSFGFKQLTNNKFDYCVLIGFNNNGAIGKTFVLTFDELKIHPLKREESLVGTNTYIMYSTAYKKSNEYKTRESKVELDLNLNPKKYEDRWDKIK